MVDTSNESVPEMAIEPFDHLSLGPCLACHLSGTAEPRTWIQRMKVLGRPLITNHHGSSFADLLMGIFWRGELRFLSSFVITES